jgi:hypothetical protein
MANMLEGGGKTPILPPEELQALGFKLVAYPLSLLGVSVRAMQDALIGLKSGRIPGVREMGTFVDLQMAVGFPVSQKVDCYNLLMCYSYVMNCRWALMLSVMHGTYHGLNHS